MSLSHCCGGILVHSSVQNCFNSATLEGFRAWMDCLRSCHSISIGFKSGLWFGHSKTLILFFLSHSEMDLLVFGIIVLLHNPSALDLEVTNWQPNILLQDFLIECRIYGSISPQNICPKVLGIIKIFFWQMWDEFVTLCSFWSAMAFALELSHGCLFLIVESWTLTLKGSYYALLQSLDFVLGCTRTCSHAWWFEKHIIFHIIYIITIPLSPAWHKWLN